MIANNAIGVYESIRKNLTTFVCFQVAFAMAGLLIALFFYNVLFKVSVDISVGYLAAHTVSDYLMSPASWIAGILFISIAAFHCFVGIVSIVYLNECSRQGVLVRFRDVLKFGFKTVIHMISPENWKLVIMVVVILPVVNVGVMPLAGSFIIPDFIMEYIGYYWYLTVAFYFGMFLLALLIIRWRYVIHAMVIEGISYKQALARSRQIGKGHHLGDMVKMVLLQLGLGACAVLLIVVFAGFALLMGVLATQASGAWKLMLGAFSGVLAVSGIILGAGTFMLSVPVNYSFLSVSYYKRQLKKEGQIHGLSLNIPAYAEHNWALVFMGGLISVLLVAFTSLFIVNTLDGSITKYISAEDVTEIVGDHQTSVVAHRCGAHYAPENTIAALNKAADMGVEWCEIDAQQLADGTIIVMHDTNFARTTGWNKNSWEATWDEVQSLDAGSFYSSQYAGEGIPQLDAMIKAAKSRNIKLQIEIKPTHHEANLEQAVVDVVLVNNFQNDCRIASQDYECLQKVRAYNSAVRTLYITSIAFGDILKADAADDFSIEATWITQELVDYLHADNRVVFAWTVNSEEIMENCVFCDVDALVTDEVELAVNIANIASSGSLAKGIGYLLGL